MIATEPKVSVTGRYSIAKTAKILEVHRCTVYNYNKNGALLIYHNKINNRPFIKGSDILKVWYLYY